MDFDFRTTSSLQVKQGYLVLIHEKNEDQNTLTYGIVKSILLEGEVKLETKEVGKVIQVLKKPPILMSFPKKEHNNINKRLRTNKVLYTTRISKEQGFYQMRDVVKTNFGYFMKVTSVNTYTDVKKHPFFHELTKDQKRILDGHPFDLVKLQVIGEVKQDEDETFPSHQFCI